MSLTLSAYILKYGYIAIFSLVFLQEIGVPNPVPNEIVLLFSGYLSSVGKLDCITVLITVIAADAIGSSCLYTTFYYFGQRLLQKWPRVIPTSKLAHLTARVAHQDRWSIYVGRHIPFIRGYTAVVITDPPWHILTRCPLVGTYLEWRVCHGWQTFGTRLRRCCRKVSDRKTCLGRIGSIMHHCFSLATYVPLLKKQKNTHFWMELRKGRRQQQPRVSA
jgi:hypothetical protein